MIKKQFTVWGTRTLSVLALAFAVQYWGTPMYKQYFSPKKISVFVPTAKVQHGQFAVSFHEIGTLDAANSTQVVSSVNGKIISLVPEGTIVKAGDILVELDTADVQREVRSAELSYQNSLADVERAKSNMLILQATNNTEREKTKAQYDFDKNELERAKTERDRKKRLADKKLVPGSSLEEAEFTVRSKELALKKSEMDNTLKEKEIQEKEDQQKADIRKAEFSANIQKNNLDEEKSRFSGCIIKAPAPGMVVLNQNWNGEMSQKFKEGDSVSPRRAICQLPDLSNMHVKVKVGEANMPKLKLGQTALIRVEAIPNKVFHGTVKEIASLAAEADMWSGDAPGRKSFEIEVALKEADPKVIKPGMTADVEFVCDSIKDALYVPLEAVVERDGKTWVFVQHGKRYDRVAVKLGKNNENYVVVKSGLKKGDIVALRDPTRSLDQQDSEDAKKAEKKHEKKKSAPMPGAGG